MGNMDFNAGDYQARTEMAAVPAGKYLCRIEDTERKNTKNNEAQYLQITHVVTEGEYKGRKIFERLNLWTAQGLERFNDYLHSRSCGGRARRRAVPRTHGD